MTERMVSSNSDLIAAWDRTPMSAGDTDLFNLQVLAQCRIAMALEALVEGQKTVNAHLLSLEINTRKW